MGEMATRLGIVRREDADDMSVGSLLRKGRSHVVALAAAHDVTR